MVVICFNIIVKKRNNNCKSNIKKRKKLIKKKGGKEKNLLSLVYILKIFLFYKVVYFEIINFSVFFDIKLIID